MTRPSSGSTQAAAAGSHIGIEAVRDGAIIAAPAAPASSRVASRTGAPRTQAKIALQARRARGAAGDAHSSRHGAHRRVAIAGGEGEALVDARTSPAKPTPFDRPMICARAFGVDERPALAGLVDIGMVERLARLAPATPPHRARAGRVAIEAWPSSSAASRARSSSQSILRVAAMFDCICAHVPGTGNAMV